MILAMAGEALARNAERVGGLAALEEGGGGGGAGEEEEEVSKAERMGS